MATTSSLTDSRLREYLIHHIFLPPQLPQKSDALPGSDDALLKITLEALEAMKLLVPGEFNSIDAACHLIINSRQAHTANGRVNEGKLLELLNQIVERGHPMALHIHEQNAGILISKTDEAIHFEVFELAPQNSAVYSAAGRLQRRFPGSAAAVKIPVFEEDGFQAVVAHTLAQMSQQEADSMQPQIRKSGVTVDEYRDTSNPALVTELFMAFLLSAGRPVTIPVVTKNTREEVLWSNARFPWRRSPFWLLVRVSLQITFSKKSESYSKGRKLYKTFMIHLMSRVLMHLQAHPGLSSELKYIMNAKIARRLLKLGPSCEQPILDLAQQNLELISRQLEDSWSSLQRVEAIDMSQLSSLDCANDSMIALPALDDYIRKIQARLPNKGSSEFSPSTGLLEFQANKLPNLDDARKRDYTNFNLYSFEMWVFARLDQWMVRHGSNANTCTKLESLIKDYHGLAVQQYTGKPEDTSLMLLTIMQLWKACDTSAVALCPLLAQYQPAPSFDFAQNLLLPLKKQMQVLRTIEQYRDSRMARATHSASEVFMRVRGPESFAARYFDQSPSHQSLLEKIVRQAKENKRKKLEDLRRMKAEYENLMKQYGESSCDYRTVTTEDEYGEEVETKEHKSSCIRCGYASEANGMRITIHEWPLPVDITTQKVITFELQVPQFIASWRNITMYFLHDVLKAGYSADSTARASYPLSRDSQLAHPYFQATETQRLVLLSEDKPHTHTHRNSHVVSTATDSDVCVPCGSAYKYYDDDLSCFTQDVDFTEKIPLACTYTLPGRSSSLQKFIYRPAHLPNGQPPNLVISSQSDCPEHMTLQEYRALSSVAGGCHLQWLNILLQLGLPSISFKKQETTLVILQCVFQAGPAADTVVRAGHTYLTDRSFAKKLLAELKTALYRIQENWEMLTALSVLISIAARLLSLNESLDIQSASLDFLSDARHVALKWVKELHDIVQRVETDESRKEYLSKRGEAALICVESFSAENVHLEQILAKTDPASILIQCAIVVQETKLILSGSSDSMITHLLSRHSRLLHRCYVNLAKNHVALHDAISQCFASYVPGSPWIAAKSDHWLMTKTKAGPADEGMTVHLNVLNGELLVNGLPLNRLPAQYEAHPMYRTLFGNTAMEIIPSTSPGMEFAARRRYAGFSLEFGRVTDDGHLVVRTSKASRTHELIPPALLGSLFPSAFSSDYLHWYDVSTGQIELRPVKTPWEMSSAENWILSRGRANSNWRLTRNRSDGVALLPLTSKSSRLLCGMLSPLADATNIHICFHAILGMTEIEIPGLQLSFKVQPGRTDVQSKEFPNMIIDSSQAVGTLIGLQNLLVLKHARGSRLLIVLDGPVSFNKTGDEGHVKVDVAKSSRTGTFHTFDVDQRLGRLVDNGSMQSKLMIAYLHALTSHCLPDPLTGKTGMEQALSILSSAAVKSSQSLSQDNISVLSRIAALAPIRNYYPRNLQVMQTINWSPHLGFLCQSTALFAAAQCLWDQAKATASIFTPDSIMEPLEMRESSPNLIRRESIRSAVFRTSEYGAEDFDVSQDRSYQARDRRLDSNEFRDAYMISNFIFERKQNLDSHLPNNLAESLWNLLPKDSPVLSPTQALDLSKIKYDAILLSKPQMILPSWNSLIRSLRYRANRFFVMIYLATMTFSRMDKLDRTLLQILALSFTRDDLAQIDTSAMTASYYHLAHGRIVDQPTLRTTVKGALVGLESSPDSSLQKGTYETKNAHKHRKRQSYERNTNPIVSAIVDGLATQWPCEVPRKPNLSRLANVSSYIDMDFTMNAVLPDFRRWSDNLKFFQYLQNLGSLLSTLTVTATVVPHLGPVPVYPMHTGDAPGISVQDLFAGEAPQIQLDHNSFNVSPSIVSKTRTSQGLRLSGLIASLRIAASQSQYENEYLRRLEDSAAHLNEAADLDDVEVSGCDQQYVQAYLQHCKTDVNTVYQALLSATSPGSCQNLVRAMPAWTAKLWPRLSPTFFLEQLSHKRWPKLSKPWQKAIVQYALALTELQRSERLAKVVSSGSTVDLVKELNNKGHVNWEPMKYPDSLLLEVESGVLIREVQEQIAGHMRSPEHASNIVLQLNMGEGKSSLILPTVAAALADGSKLVRVVVAKPQSKQMVDMLTAKIGGLLGRRVYYMPFSRALKPSKASADAIGRLVRDCRLTGGILLVQPEHILSFKLMGLESLIEGKEDVGNSVLATQDFFNQYARDVVDESDENFSTKFELIYTVGQQTQIDASPSRWLVIQEVLGLIRKFSHDTAHACPGSLEIRHCSHGQFPRTRILKDDGQIDLFARITRYICDTGLDGFPIARQSRETRSAVLLYISKLDLSAAEIEQVERLGPSSFWSESTKDTLLLLRGLFAAGVLSFVFGQKRWRVNFGTDATRNPSTRLAVPFRAKDNPSPRAEYSHPDVVILLTTLSYYYGGLEEDCLLAAFDHLLRSDQADIVYQAWVADTDQMPATFAQLQGVNLRDNHQFVTEIHPRLCYSKAVIDYFLANLVFPKEMKEFKYKLSASGWDLGAVKTHPCTGFSGTNDTRTVLPLHVTQMDLEEQKHTNALVLEYLLRSENSVAHLPPATSASDTDAGRLLDMVMALHPPARVILDVGAQILELTNHEVAVAWLAKHGEDVQAAIYVNEFDELFVVARSGRVESLQTSSFASQLESCIVFLDESHTRGIDLRLPEHYRAAVTLGSGLVKDRLVQACMRLRKLGKGQTVVFCVPEEIRSRIIQRTGNPESATIEVADILNWVIQESWSDIRRSMPLWAVQGKRFVAQERLWQQARTSNKTSLSKEDAEKFLEDEAQSLEHRYRPNADSSGEIMFMDVDESPSMTQIKQRCLQFDNLGFGSASLQEEQERELAPEIEQERQIQKAPPASPRKHAVHKHIKSFVNTGKIPSGSAALSKAFTSLADTDAAKWIDLEELTDQAGPDLCVTVDFAKTIDTGARTVGTQQDSFLRPVQYILLSMDDEIVSTMIIISPHEAQELLPSIQESTKVALHLYTPRSNVGSRSLDRLDFIHVGGSSGSTPRIHPRLICQLNIFAGQLYLTSYDDLVYMYNYLGLAVGTAAEGWEIAADGFILKDDKGKVGGQHSALTKSPVKFLQALTTMRRDGEGIARTDMGILLEGRILEPSHFDR